MATAVVSEPAITLENDHAVTALLGQFKREDIITTAHSPGWNSVAVRLDVHEPRQKILFVYLLQSTHSI